VKTLSRPSRHTSQGLQITAASCSTLAVALRAVAVISGGPSG
jgi:hypothetical protein